MQDITSTPISKVKCDLCDTPADFKISNPSAKDQSVCKAHLPWIYNIKALPENVVSLDSEAQLYAAALREKELAGSGEVKNASRKNSDKASASSTKQSDSAEGTVPAGDTSGN